MPAEAEFAERFLHHRTVFPRDFLADYGFFTLRSAGRVELMRLELGGLQPVVEDGRVAQAVRRAAEIIAGRRPRRAGSTRRTFRAHGERRRAGPARRLCRG